MASNLPPTSPKQRTRTTRYRRAGLGALILAGVCATLSLLSFAGVWPSPPALQILLSGLTVWYVLVTWYTLRLVGSSLGQAAGGTGRSPARRLAMMAADDGSATSIEQSRLSARLKEEQARVDRGGGTLSLLFVAIEKLDEVNARFGRQVAAKVAGDVAATMAAGLRLYDMIGRVSEEECLAVLPSTNRRTARRVAERLVRDVEKRKHSLPDGGTVDFVYVSAGIATYPLNGETIQDVVRAARNAMEAARRQESGPVVVSEQFLRIDEAGEEVATEPEADSE